jgi:uncharacterized protein
MPTPMKITPNAPLSTTDTLQTKPWYAPWYGHLWPWLLMLGPFLVILAGGYTSWLAFTQQDALVVGDYYKQGKAINQDLRRDVAATGLQLASTLRYDPAAGQLTGTISSRGAPLQGPLILSLNHSTLPEKDIRLNVTANSKGVFQAPLPLLEMARWQVLIESERRDWRLASTWIWPRNKDVILRADGLPEKPQE